MDAVRNTDRAEAAPSADEMADRLAWRAAPLHTLASLLLAVFGTTWLAPSNSSVWLVMVALLATVAWLRRAPAATTATRVRLALAWGLLWSAFSLLAAGTNAVPQLHALLAPVLILGALLLWSRPPLLILHSTLIALPTVVMMLAVAHWPQAMLLTACALLACVGGASARRALAQVSPPVSTTPSTPAEGPPASGVDEHAALLDATDDALLIVDAEGRIESLNSVAQHLTGARTGERFRDAVPLVEPDTRRRVRDPVAECLRTGAVVNAEEWLALLAGPVRECSVALRATSLPGRRVLITLRDQTELRTLERLQTLQAGRDPVTGLQNRHELERRYRRLQEKDHRGEHALCCLELEQVGLVNEACGYAAGDDLLRRTALQLGDAARADDCVARLGGGQFALLLPGCDADAARGVAGKLLAAIEATGFPWQQRHFALSAHVGVAPFRADRTPLADVLAAALSACRVAAETEGEPIHVYRDGDAALARHAELREWMQRVQDAVAHGRFELLAHDIRPIGSAGGVRRNAELLVRMRDENDALVAPGLFLGAAERLQLMPAIDRWVVREALAIMARPDGPLNDYGFCAINLSGQSLSQPELGEFIEQSLHESGVAPERVCFEITESAVIADLGAAGALMTRLRGHGCRFALDDFGTGLSSYAYLKQLPADLLKIDGTFVRGLLADSTDRAVVESINQVGHLVGMHTIAEYVQNVATLAALEQMGVDYAQGSLFGEARPVTREA